MFNISSKIRTICFVKGGQRNTFTPSRGTVQACGTVAFNPGDFVPLCLEAFLVVSVEGIDAPGMQ
jgi:hypothetical protein